MIILGEGNMSSRKHPARLCAGMLTLALFCCFQNCSPSLRLANLESVHSSSRRLASVNSLPTRPEVTVSADSIVSVDSYGAKPDGVTDSTAAFQYAIDAVINSRGTLKQITLSAGTYFLKCSSPSGATPLALLLWPLPPGATPQAQPGVSCLKITEANHFNLTGQGQEKTKILIGNPTVGLIDVTASNDVSVSSFSVDYSSLPFTQGVIQSVNPETNSFVVELDAGYPQLDQVIFSKEYFPQSYAMVMEREQVAVKVPRLKTTTKNYFANLTT